MQNERRLEYLVLARYIHCSRERPRVQDCSASSISFITSSSLNRCMSFRDENAVSEAPALSIWIWCIYQSRTLGTTFCLELYHWCVELISVFPLFLASLHHINLVIVKIPLCLYILDHNF